MNEKKNENDMILNIENKNNNVFLVDQTPTPTRLIKNCEEVGLFDDLNNVNPFDETFRRAIESKNTHLDTHSENLSINEDTLHTPQVILPFTKNDSNQEISHCNNKTKSSSENLNKITKNRTDFKRQKSNSKRSKLENIISRDNDTANRNPRRILPKFQIKTNTIVLPAVNIVSQCGSEVMINLSNNNLVKKSLVLPNAHSPPDASTQSSEKPPPARQLSIKEKLKSLISQKDASIYSAELDIKKTPEVKTIKKKIFKEQNPNSLERKRAASSRYRKKVKLEYSNLEKDKLKLQAENLQLKETIKELQMFVLEHRNCDLSRKCIEKSPNGTTAQLLMKQLPQIQIEPSTIIMNLPRFIIQPAVEVLFNEQHQQINKPSQKS